ncbi:agglutinin-2-like [Rutidosis leptorrhynchoides]|uniref:agglutinin-2-like n=1 Tax=Rutidosis leptorrhynchoides TaxID=125765 RepID=UPI003A999AC0
MVALFTVCFLLVLIHYAASISFNVTNISPKFNDMFQFDQGASVSDEGIQVTPQDSSNPMLTGRATYFKPFHLWNKTSWELANFNTEFSFVINSKGSSNFADGLTFFLAENNTLISPGGAMGLPVNASTYMMTYQFVAVEFDTYGNNNWDIATNMSEKHAGIDVNSLKSVTSQRWDADIKGGSDNRASIMYDSLSKNLHVVVSNNEAVVNELNHIIDLTKVLPEWVIFGFSAATGGYFETHTVKSWTFNSSELQVEVVSPASGLPPSTNLPPSTSQPPSKSHSGSVWGKYKTLILVIVGLVTAGSLGSIVLCQFDINICSFCSRCKFCSGTTYNFNILHRH